jgi:Protein of unknown function (DUF4239)
MPYFIYEIPTAWLAIYCSLLFVGLTWFGIIFIKPFLRLVIGRDPRINELVFHTSAGFSLFYGLLLGLLAVAAYQNFDEVRRSVFAEAATLGLLYRDAGSYPDPVGPEVQELLRDYTLYVIYKDWPAHHEGLIYKGGSNRLTMIQHSILKFQPQTTSQGILHAQTLADFNDFVVARQSRLASVRTQLPGVLWYAVGIGALINIVLIWMLNMRFFTHMLLGAIVSFFLGVMIFLIASLDNPMRGDVSVSPDNYQLVYDVMMVWDEEGAGANGGL